MVEPLSKNILTLQIEKTAAKLAKQGHRSNPKYNAVEREEALKQELAELQQKKIDAKLYHARKELRATFKKCRAMELQKQIKRIREAQKSEESPEPVEETPVDTEKKEKKQQKKLTKDDVPRLENEREVLKTMDLDALAERSLRSKILKHEELGQNEIVKSASALAEPAVAPELTQTLLDMSGRILRHKTAQEQFTRLISSIKFILNPTAPEHQKQRELAGKKRKHDEQRSNTQRSGNQNFSASSMFVDSLGGGGQDRPKPKKSKSGLDWEDPDFDKYYHGEEKKKPNRMGQRNRRKLHAEQYGKEADHIKEARKAKQHLAKKGDKKDSKDGSAPKPKPKPKPKSQQQNMDEFHPSWQAKKQQQEMMAAALSGTAKPVNNKIVFD